jgi:hypothetical protein
MTSVTSMTSASVIEVAGSSADVLRRAAELRSRGWTVAVRGTRLTRTCEVDWELEVERKAG